jgi:SAM-dependent methyltransferase
MNKCRVCSAFLQSPDYESTAPAITSIATQLPISTKVFICRSCGHGQSPDLPRIKEFYDTEYRISLQSEQHDQLYEVREGKPIYRTQHQAEMLATIGLPLQARVLDFGAAKGTTLRTLLDLRPDLRPSIFDVSNDYIKFWRGWIPESEQAVHHLPGSWHGRFDLVTAHFVLEHVVNPIETLKSLADLLAPGGKLFFTVPDSLANTGDFLVVDHLNHFSTSSLVTACKASSLVPLTLTGDQFRGAYMVIAQNAKSPASPRYRFHCNIASDVNNALESLSFWSRALASLDADQQIDCISPVAVYGAGFYGALIMSRLHQPPICFLDRNKFLQGRDYLGVPVFPPEECPGLIRKIYPGLNPRQARSILADADSWMPLAAKIHYLSS